MRVVWRKGCERESGLRAREGGRERGKKKSKTRQDRKNRDRDRDRQMQTQLRQEGKKKSGERETHRVRSGTAGIQLNERSTDTRAAVSEGCDMNMKGLFMRAPWVCL